MNKIILIVLCLAAAFGSTPAQKNNTEAERQVKFESYAAARYFERNDSNLMGKSSYLVFTNEESFERIFHPAAINGYNLFLPSNVFDAKLVIAAINRGHFLRTYDLKKVTAKQGKLYVWYNSTDRQVPESTYNSHLILTVDKNNYSEIIFMENGKRAGTVSVTQGKAETAPETVIKNLYAAQKNPETAPFFQAKNRALLDRYFDAFIGDMIWKDAVDAAHGKAGAFNFNPLFSSQNPQTTAFTISRDARLGDADNAWVDVTFKNAGKAEEAHFEMQTDDAKNWKIKNIYYSDRRDLSTLLRRSQDAEFRAADDKETLFNGDFIVGAVRCTFLPIDPLKFRVKCANRNDYQVYTDQGDGVLANYIERDGKFIKQSEFIFTFDTDSQQIKTGKFIDASGKEVKVTRIKANNSNTVLGVPNSIEKNHTGTGELETGATESIISQFNKQGTDYAAYCFTNKSAVGRAILARCKNRQKCEFTGTVEPGKCKTPEYLNPPSSSRRITEITSVKFAPSNPITAKKGTIEYLAQTLAAAFESGTMGNLDAGKPYLNRVEIVFEDSLSDDKTSKTYKTLKAAEQSFRGQNDEGNFVSQQFKSCANGVCSFEGGVLHNTLFLHKITYTVVKGRPYIKAIHFITG